MEFVTVLYKVEDKDVFKLKFTEMCHSLGYDALIDGAKVVAIDKGDLFKELEDLEFRMEELEC